MPIEIKPGPELDCAVAEASGLSGCRPWVPFRPSTDLNAAFAAAEKAGLFRGYNLGIYVDNATKQERWTIGLTCDYSSNDDVLSEADTPALVICLAILKLKET